MNRWAKAAAAGVVVCSVIAVLGAALVGAVFCAATLHVPRRTGPVPSGAEDVAIVARDGARMRAWRMRPAVANGNCVMVLHGLGDSRVGGAGFAPAFLDSGYEVLAPDSRAHGNSEGRFVTYGLLEKYDTVAWAEWMRAAGCRKIYGLGESLGASVLIQAAAVKPVFAAIVAECPFADLREIAEYRAGFGLAGKAVVASGMLYARMVDGLDFREVSPLRSIAAASTPVLLIHGLADRRTPSSNSVKLAAADRSNVLWLVPNAGHTAAAFAATAEFWRRVLGWFDKH